MRNEEYDKALKQAQIEISNARKLAHDLEQLQKVHQDDSQKFLDLQRETQQIGLYRETIKMQEKSISKYEALLKKTMTDSNRQKESLLELEQLRTENLTLQRELKDIVVSVTPGIVGRGNTELEKYKKEVARLEKITHELQSELSNKRPISAERKNIQNEVLELEVKYHKAVSRVRALEDEIHESAKKYAKEISQLKMILADKESIIETLRMENAL